MMFMKDSERAASKARAEGIMMGLHLNFTEEFSGTDVAEGLITRQRKIRRFLKVNKYSMIIYNPFLRRDFEYVFNAQLEEFYRLSGGPPTHIDGHEHMHLCMNILLEGLIPRGVQIRRNHTFESGERGVLNRAYRMIVDKWLLKNYILTDFFFDLSQNMDMRCLQRIFNLAQSSDVELMVHPGRINEFEYLESDEYWQLISCLDMKSSSNPK